MGEVSDSVHLRRFCRIGISGPVPDESTVGKLTRRLGPEVVHELTRLVIAKAWREKRFRPRAARIDSIVVEADVALPDRRRVGLRRGEGACAGGSQARADDQRRSAPRSGIARVRSAGGCAGSPARCAAAGGRRRPRC